MRLLVDTHALIWAVDDASKLGKDASRELRNKSNDLLVSAAVIWEIAIKWGLGKLKLSLPYRQWMVQAITVLDGKILPITVEYADVQATLPFHHRDPFDRLLIAQSTTEKVAIVSIDSVFDLYSVARIW